MSGVKAVIGRPERVPARYRTAGSEGGARKSGIDVIGGVRWGTHFCQFYRTPQDLIDILVPYFKAGLESNEFCMWVTSDPLQEGEAREAMRRAMPDFDRYLEKGSIEILPHTQWYLRGGVFDQRRVLDAWVEKHDAALQRGYDGLRLSGNTFWLEKALWKDFDEYEHAVNSVIGDYRMIALCTYSLEQCSVAEVIDVVQSHQFALIKREGRWVWIESAERRAGAYTRSLIEASLDPLLAIGLDGRITDVNAAMEAVTGCSRQELIGQHFSGCFTEPEKARAGYEQVLREESVRDYALEIRHRDGRVTPVLYNASIYRDETGQVIGVFAAARDITARRRIEEALRLSRNLLERAFESIHVLIAYMDRDFNFLRVNRAYAAADGRDPDFFVGKNHFALYPNPENEAIFRKVVETGEPYAVRARPFTYPEHPERGVSYWDWRVEPVKDARGKTEGLIMSLLDVTEPTRAEQELRRLNRELQESEAKLKRAQHLAHLSHWEWDLVSGAVTRSDELGRIAGRDLPTRDTDLRYDLIHPDDRERVRKTLERVVETKQPATYELRLLRADGTERLMEGRAEVICDERSKPMRLIGTILDVTERKRVEEALRESESRLNQAQRIARIGGWELNLVDNVLVWSDEIYRIFEIDPAKFGASYEAFLEAIHPDDRAAVDFAYRNSVKTRTPYSIEHRLLFPDGRIKYVHEQCETFYEDGMPVRSVGTVQDITERKRAEAEVRQLAAIVESSDDAIIGKTPEGTILSWNRGAESIYGYSAEEVKGRSIAILSPPDRPDEIQKILQTIRQGGRVEHYETVRIRKDGTPIDVSLTISPIRDASGTIIGASSIARDITARQRAEEALRAASAYNRRLIEASLDPLVTIGPDGKITDVNAATEAATGYTRGELIGTDFSDYCSEPEKARTGYQRAFREGTVRDYELEIRHRDGRTTPVLYNASVYRDEAGQVVGVFAAARDVTARRQAEALLWLRAREQAELARLGQDALAATDLGALMDEAVALTAETLGVEYCKILELLPEGKALLLRAGIGWQEGLVGRATVSAGRESQAGYTLLSDAPVIVEDLSTETRFSGPPLLREHGVVSGLSVIIGRRERPYGVMGVHTTRRRAFSRDDVNFLQAIANVIGTAIERRRAEEAVRQSEERYRNIFESAAVALWEEDFSELKAAVDDLKAQGITDFRAYIGEHPDFARKAAKMVKIREVNPQSLKMFGAESKEELLASLDKVFTPESYQVFAQEPVAIAQGARYFEAEAAVQTLQGEPRDIFITIAFPDAASRFDRVLVGMVDITERKRAEGKLLRLNQELEKTLAELRATQQRVIQTEKLSALGTLAAGVAHELNNPMMGVLNYVDYARGVSRDPKVQQVLSEADRELRRMRDLLKNMLTFARPIAERLSEVNVGEVLERALQLLAAEFRARQISVAKDIPESLAPVAAKEGHLQQVFVNLLMNARDAVETTAEKKVAVSAYERGGWIWVRVQDTGTGIPAEIQNRIFDPFFTTKAPGKGTGLGLSICQSIVEDLGGTISVQSRPGAGATFTVKLPKYRAGNGGVRRKDDAQTDSGHRR